MANWFRTCYDDEDLWLCFEADGEGWAVRQVEFRGQDWQPVTAASLAEVAHVRDHADRAVMGRYERQYGVLADGHRRVAGAAPGSRDLCGGVLV
ncbi:hypothetical protein [Nocardiopsis ansamitocini]|nr:hypothetical protein [Nocardiopsis ansamitocini]